MQKNNMKSIRYGGSAWESNPPETGLAPHTGFEVLFWGKNSQIMSNLGNRIS